jgi:hypothetical protein
VPATGRIARSPVWRTAVIGAAPPGPEDEAVVRFS